MTDQMLRDLLEERVTDLTAPDLTTGAWRAGRRARRRDRLVAVGAAVVVTAAIGSGVAVLRDGGTTGPEPAPALPHPPATGAISREPDATYQGVPVWFSPSRQEEGALPVLDADGLPRVIDLESGPMVKAMDHAVAAFAVGNDTVRLVDASGGQVSVSIDRLDDVTKPNGYAYRPFTSTMLSPGGTRLIFPQDGSVAIYSLDGGWTEIDTGGAETRFVTWVTDDAFVLLNERGSVTGGYLVSGGRVSDLGAPTRLRPLFSVGDAQAYGPTKRSGDARAQSYGMGVPIPVADAGEYLSDPEFVYAEAGGKLAVLSITWTIHEDSDSGRSLQCCPVAGWLDDRTLVYESKQTDPGLVAWTVGTDRFALVSTIRGEYGLASFADLG